MMDLHDARAVLTALVSSTGHREAIEALPVVLADLDAARARVAELEATAQTVCASLDDAGRLHATTGGPELDAILRTGS